MNFDFAIKSWSAYAADLRTPEAWQSWAAAPDLPVGNAPPEVPEVPTMMRRRLSDLGKMAVRVAHGCLAAPGSVPVVMTSRYGDALRSIGLLTDLAHDHPLSPASFGMSVHNAIGAQYSIARGNHDNSLAVAAGASSATAAVVEAAGLLGDGADDVLLVCYGTPLSEEYARFADEAACSYAWAWLMTAQEDAGCQRFNLSVDAATSEADPEAPGLLPFDLDVMRFVLTDDVSLTRTTDGRTWTLRRHA